MIASSKEYLGELSVFGRASQLIYKLHGVFMVIAWIGSTSLGIIFATHFRDQFSHIKIKGKDVWFVVSNNLTI